MNSLQKKCLTGAIFGCMMFLASLFVLQGSLLNHVIEHFSLSDVSQGLPSTVASIGAVLALISSFFLIGRLSKLNIMRIAVGITSCFLIIMPFVSDFYVFVLVWFGIGICLGYIDMLVSSCMADLYEGKTATRMMCILHATYGATSMLLPLLITLLLNYGLPWKNVYLIVAALGIAILFLMTLIMAKAPGATGTIAEANVLSFRDMKALFFTPTFPLFAVAILFHGMFLSGCITWINRYVGVTLESSLGDLALSFIFAGVLGGRLVFSFLPLDTEKYIRSAGFLSGIIFCIAVMSGNGTIVCGAALVCGFLFGPLIPCLLTLSCNVVKKSSMFATTVMMLCLYIGEAVIHPLISKLESLAGLGAGMILIAVMMCATSLMCVLNRKQSCTM